MSDVPQVCGFCHFAKQPPKQKDPQGNEIEVPAHVRMCIGSPPTIIATQQQVLTEKKHLLSNPNLPPVQVVTQLTPHRGAPVSVNDDACAFFKPKKTDEGTGPA